MGEILLLLFHCYLEAHGSHIAHSTICEVSRESLGVGELLLRPTHHGLLLLTRILFPIAGTMGFPEGIK